MNMNYMINDPASKEVAIAFAQWTIITRMWQSDLTFEEQYESWVSGMDSVYELEADDDVVARIVKYDDFERQLEYMAGAYED
jgi:hypothetical protein